MLAIIGRHLDVTQLLIDAGTELNTRSSKSFVDFISTVRTFIGRGYAVRIYPGAHVHGGRTVADFPVFGAARGNRVRVSSNEPGPQAGARLAGDYTGDAERALGRIGLTN